MKKQLTLLMCAAAFATQAQTLYPTGAAGCIARWNFNSTGTITSLPDVSGNNNSGTINSLVATTGFRNVANQAMHFNGTSSSASVPSTALLNPQKLSIISVVRFSGFYSGTCQTNNIIYKSASAYYTPGCWAMLVSDQDNNCSTYTPSAEALDFAGSSTVYYPQATSNFVNQNQWYFMAVTYDSTMIRRYMIPMDSAMHYTNAIPISTAAATIALGANSAPVTIGATINGSYPFWFNGDMDELAVFNRAISDAEIQAVYDYLWNQFAPVPPTTGVAPASVLESNVIAKNGTIYLTVQNEGKSYTTTIYDVSGKKLFTGSNTAATANFDMSSTRGQILFVRIQSSKGTVTKKVFNP